MRAVRPPPTAAGRRARVWGAGRAPPWRQATAVLPGAGGRPCAPPPLHTSPLPFRRLAQFVEGVHTTLPYSLAVYLVRALLEGNEATGTPGPPPSEAVVGWMTGVLAACWSAAQFATSLPWGRASDAHGRKPLIIMSAASSGVSVLFFGTSRSYAAACAARLVGGAFNCTFVCIVRAKERGMVGRGGGEAVGALAVGRGRCAPPPRLPRPRHAATRFPHIPFSLAPCSPALSSYQKCMIGEAAGGSDQARPMSLLALGWGFGTIVGPALGALASPCAPGAWLAGRAVCSPGSTLAAFPFLLPCAAASALSAVAVIWSACVLEETLPAKAGGGGGGRAASGARRSLARVSTFSSPYVGPGPAAGGSASAMGDLELAPSAGRPLLAGHELSSGLGSGPPSGLGRALGGSGLGERGGSGVAFSSPPRVPEVGTAEGAPGLPPNLPPVASLAAADAAERGFAAVRPRDPRLPASAFRSGPGALPLPTPTKIALPTGPGHGAPKPAPPSSPTLPLSPLAADAPPGPPWYRSRAVQLALAGYGCTAFLVRAGGRGVRVWWLGVVMGRRRRSPPPLHPSSVPIFSSLPNLSPLTLQHIFSSTCSTSCCQYTALPPRPRAAWACHHPSWPCRWLSAASR